jgi:hypothetical protein
MLVGLTVTDCENADGKAKAAKQAASAQRRSRVLIIKSWIFFDRLWTRRESGGVQPFAQKAFFKT